MLTAFFAGSVVWPSSWFIDPSAAPGGSSGAVSPHGSCWSRTSSKNPPGSAKISLGGGPDFFGEEEVLDLLAAHLRTHALPEEAIQHQLRLLEVADVDVERVAERYPEDGLSEPEEAVEVVVLHEPLVGDMVEDWLVRLRRGGSQMTRSCPTATMKNMQATVSFSSSGSKMETSDFQPKARRKRMAKA